MESGTAERGTEGPGGLDAATMAEAFQITAKENAGEVALRTKDDSVSITWGEYAEKVKTLAAGLAALGVEKGQTVGLMLTNRPEFHLYDAAVMHLGATPFSVYNTYTPEQIAYLAKDAANRVFITEREFLDRVKPVEEVDHVILVDGEEEGVLSTADIEERGEEGFDFEAAWRAAREMEERGEGGLAFGAAGRAAEPGAVLTLIYPGGTTGPPKGVQIT